MSEQQEPSALMASFAEHVRAFHHSLPDAEKQLLEQVFALAGAASAPAGDEVSGYEYVYHPIKLTTALGGEALAPLTSFFPLPGGATQWKKGGAKT